MPKEYQAELTKAKAEARATEIEWQNVKILAEKNIVSNSEVAMAQSKFDEAKAEEALAELHVSFTKIKAPFDGIIDRISFKAGSLIDEGTLLTSIYIANDLFKSARANYLEVLMTQRDALSIASLQLFLFVTKSYIFAP